MATHPRLPSQANPDSPCPGGKPASSRHPTRQARCRALPPRLRRHAGRTMHGTRATWQEDKGNALSCCRLKHRLKARGMEGSHVLARCQQPTGTCPRASCRLQEPEAGRTGQDWTASGPRLPSPKAECLGPSLHFCRGQPAGDSMSPAGAAARNSSCRLACAGLLLAAPASACGPRGASSQKHRLKRPRQRFRHAGCHVSYEPLPPAEMAATTTAAGRQPRPRQGLERLRHHSGRPFPALSCQDMRAVPFRFSNVAETVARV